MALPCAPRCSGRLTKRRPFARVRQAWQPPTEYDPAGSPLPASKALGLAGCRAPRASLFRFRSIGKGDPQGGEMVVLAHEGYQGDIRRRGNGNETHGAAADRVGLVGVAPRANPLGTRGRVRNSFSVPSSAGCVPAESIIPGSKPGNTGNDEGDPALPPGFHCSRHAPCGLPPNRIPGAAKIVKGREWGTLRL